MTNKTFMINLFGGSGIGKSTTASGIFYEMKLLGKEIELVREYVKTWAWKGEKVGKFDQLYIYGKQTRAECILYGKVDYIVTDSPLLLYSVYDEYHNGKNALLTYDHIMNYIKNIEENGNVHQINFLLGRNKNFNPNGRYETEEQAKNIDIIIKKYLDEHNIDYYYIDVSDRERVGSILKIINTLIQTNI